MFRRMLVLGVAALAIALVAPAIGVQTPVSEGIAHAQDPPEAPEAPDEPDAPEAPAVVDVPSAPPADVTAPEDAADVDADDDEEEDEESGSREAAGRARNESSGGGSSEGAGRHGAVRGYVVRNTRNVSAGVDTGATPQAGIQAGGGGTASGGANPALLGLAALSVLLGAGGLALRRRGLES